VEEELLLGEWTWTDLLLGPSYAANTTEVYVTPSPAPETSTAPAYTPAPLPVTSEAPALSSKSEYVPAPAPSSKSEYAPAPTSEKPAPTSYKPAPTTSKEAEKPKPSKPAHSGGNSHITPNGQKWSLTYTPYADNGDCRTDSVIKADIAKIAKWGYTTIRVYSVDCGVFDSVLPAAEAAGLKIIYGVFLDATNGPDSEGANEQLHAIIDHAGKDSTAMVLIGNEYTFNGGSLTALVAYVKKARQMIYAAGFSEEIIVSTTETVGIMTTPGNEVICEALGALTVQIHPFFDFNTDAASAGDFALSQLEMAAKVCPEAAEKGSYITEIGWPHTGSNNGKAHATPEAQQTAIKSIVDKVGDKSCLLSYTDDGWKSKFGASDKFGVETNFGCGDIVANL
jgi:exo-beta-1,3-glucanase (GH17 family)